jgi:hypothetical protein
MRSRAVTQTEMGSTEEERVVNTFAEMMQVPVAEMMRRRLVAGLRKEDAGLTVRVRPCPATKRSRHDALRRHSHNNAGVDGRRVGYAQSRCSGARCTAFQCCSGEVDQASATTRSDGLADVEAIQQRRTACQALCPR